MANQTVPQPRLPGFGPEDSEKAEYGGPNFLPATINHFLAAAISGKMPGGVQTSQPLFPIDYMRQFGMKYAEWAPPPFDKLPSPPMELGPLGTLPGPSGDSPPAIFRVMHVVSGIDRMFNRLSLNPLQNSDLRPSPKAVKAKLWWGMPPMSDAIWASRELDEQKNIEEALAIIQQTINVFKHLLKPAIQGDMRKTHNKVWTEFDVFQDAIVALRSHKGEPAPAFNIAKLWQEYDELHFKNMEHQARAWVFKRLGILFPIWKARFMYPLEHTRQINATQDAIRIDHWSIMILNKLLDLYAEAEIYIRFRTDGFAMTQGIHQDLIGAITLEQTEEELYTIYEGMEIARVSALEAIIATGQAARTNRRHVGAPMPWFMEAPSLIFDREISMRHLSREMDNPLPLRVQAWVQALADDQSESFGFVVYQNSYSQSESEWKNFVEIADASLNSGWEGVLDPTNVKRKAKLHWVNGKSEGIPEDNLEAVRKHFQNYIQSPTFPSTLTKTACLAVTPLSYKSFSNPERKGDCRGFFTVIDPTFDPDKQTPQTEAPGYNGHFNIIDQLVWTDLFALHANLHSQTKEEYSRLAAQHPWGVYVGPTTGVKRKQWRLMGAGGRTFWNIFHNMRR